jgi:thioredoxin reductase
MTEDRTDRWCVIGAGSSGLAAAKALMEHGYRVDCFERADDVGGNWNFGKPTSRVYASTHTISSKPFTEFPDFPMPDRYPDYPHHTHLLDYFRRYAQHFGLYDVISFSTSVVRVDPIDGGRAWDVTTRSDGCEPSTRRYLGVVIANGHNWHPKVPSYPGRFDGTVMHSADYKGPEPLRGKRVLVVGAGNTGCDIAVDSAQNAAATFHSTRRGYWYAPKYSLGKPSDQVYDLFLSLRLPKPVIQALMQTTLRLTVGDLERVGLKRPDHRMLETHPIVNSQLVYYVGQGDITPVDDIARLDGDGVVFTDGRREQVDVIVYATGYLARFEFIDPAHLNCVDGRPRLFMHVFGPRHDNLFVVGLIQPDSGQFKIVHWQAEAVATAIDAQRERQPAYRRFTQVRDRHLVDQLGGGVQYKDSTRHWFEINHFEYLRRIQSVIDLLESA